MRALMSRCGAIFLFALCGCQTPPTRVVETGKREFVQVIEKAQRPIEIAENTVVLDARSSFDYGLNRVQNSLHFPWEKLAESQRTGEVLRDKRLAALRLSLLGLRPETPIVVVGYGPAGHGEEGRVAWNLLYLGFQDVQISAIDAFRKTMTPQETVAARNGNTWKVNLRDELQIDKADFLNWAKVPSGRPERHEVLIDVRSAKECAHRGNGVPDLGALNIEWTQFFTGQGRPDSRFKVKLEAMGIRPESRIVLISDHGVRSSAVAYALLSLGFINVQNFPGGWDSLQK